MDIVSLIVWLAIIGLILWVVITFVPMPQPYKQVFVAIVVILIIILLARTLLAPLPIVRGS